jgi:hypothetical protein
MGTDLWTSTTQVMNKKIKKTIWCGNPFKLAVQFKAEGYELDVEK